MYYKIVERFGPENGQGWETYLEWRGLELNCFDSIDGNMRPDLFSPDSPEDWRNCVNEDYKLSLITNFDYAKKAADRYNNSALIGVEIELEAGYVPKEGVLGFDIIDGYCDVSLITNWGTDEQRIVANDILPNGLIGNLDRALQIRDLLRKEFSEDPHAERCEVWVVYRVCT